MSSPKAEPFPEERLSGWIAPLGMTNQNIDRGVYIVQGGSTFNYMNVT
jgi:hypothetical protein